MRLADIDEIAEAPPGEVRAALRPGDFVGIYVVHPSRDDWGDGFEPFEARILDVEAPGHYMGELGDGSRVRFNERNVAAVSHSLGGVFDWIRKVAKGMVPPTPGLLPALPPEPKPGQLPVLAPAKTAKGPAPSFLDWFKPKSGLPAVRPEEAPSKKAPGKKKPGIFDWLKPKPYQGPTGVTVAPESRMTPAVKAPSMFSQIQEKPTILKKFEEAVKAIIPPAPTGPLIETPEMFRHIQPSPEVDVEAARAQQVQLWQSLFPEGQSAPEADVPVSEMFKPFAAEELAPAGGATPSGAPRQIPREEMLPPVPPENLKFLPLPPRNELLPTPLDIARGFMTRYHPIEDLWELIRQVRKDPSFQREVAKSLEGKGTGARWQFESLGMCEGNPDAFQAVSSFLGIPWQQVVERGQPVMETDERGEEFMRLTDFSRINEEIIFPAAETIYQSFEMIKPPDIPGHFELQWGGHREHACQLLVSYVEGSPINPGAPPREEAAVAQTGQSFTTLGDIVPHEVMPDITDILNALVRNEIDKVEGLRRLTFVLDKHEKELTAKGVLPSYLAVWLLSSIDQMRGES